MTDTPMEIVTWEQVVGMCRDLAHRMRDRSFDAVLGIARGGLVPTALIAQELGLRDVMVASVASYSGDVPGPLRFLQFPEDRQLAGRRVLVADDTWETGHTLHEVRERAERAGAEVTVAVLHYKPKRSLYLAEHPDLWCVETAEWVLYPWERDT